MPETVIRKMNMSDTKSLAELDRLCFSMAWSEKAFSDEAQNKLASYLVAERDGKILGYIGYWRVVDEGHITNVAVLPECRRQRLASTLLESIIKEAYNDGLILLTLEVRKNNTPAKCLYEKFGFKKLGERKNYYHSPVEDAIIMTLMLGDNR